MHMFAYTKCKNKWLNVMQNNAFTLELPIRIKFTLHSSATVIDFSRIWMWMLNDGKFLLIFLTAKMSYRLRRPELCKMTLTVTKTLYTKCPWAFDSNDQTVIRNKTTNLPMNMFPKQRSQMNANQYELHRVSKFYGKLFTCVNMHSASGSLKFILYNFHPL